jgi:hypothetical protein
VGSVIMNCNSLCLSWKVFISSLRLEDNFAVYSNLGWQLFFQVLKYISPCFPGLLYLCWEVCCYSHKFGTSLLQLSVFFLCFILLEF